jgi:predicted GNAT family acetyltransferase
MATYAAISYLWLNEGSTHLGTTHALCAARRRLTGLHRKGTCSPPSVAASETPSAKPSRVQYVYTPPEYRRNGYAEALVRSLTRQMLREGLRAMLFADLANPTSNGIYRRIGYEAMAEIIRYRFVMANP